MTSPSNQKINELIRTFCQSPRNRFVFAEQRLAAPASKRVRLARQSERDMVREQHRTLFEYDETMQELFGGDFLEYF